MLAAVFMSEDTTIDEVITFLGRHPNKPMALIHAGFSDARRLSQELGDRSAGMRHIFLPPIVGCSTADILALENES